MEEQLRLIYLRLLVAVKANPWLIWVAVAFGLLLVSVLVIAIIMGRKREKVMVAIQKNPRAYADIYYKKRDFKKALRLYLEAGNFEGAADCLEKMGKLEDAAKLYEKTQKFSKAADLYLKLKNPLRAAECYLKDGKYQSAGEVYEKANEKERAAAAFKKGGFFERAAEIYAGLGKFKEAGACWFEGYKHIEGPLEGRKKEYFVKAAEMFMRGGEVGEAVEMFRKAGELEKAGRIAEEKGDYNLAGECYEEARAFESAVRAFKNAGNLERSALNLARLHESQGEFIKAGEIYEKLGNFTDASTMFARGGDFVRAAQVAEKGGFFREAGEFYLSAGMKEKAGECFERAGEYERAFSLYKETGNYKKVADLLLQQEKYLEAGRMYLKMKLNNEALSALSRIPPSHEDYKESVLLRFKFFTEENRIDDAIKLMEEVLKDEVISEKTVEFFYLYGTLLEKKGEDRKALEIYTRISQISPSYKDVPERINDIQKKTQKIPVVAQEDRYEIIEEIGRGGMGVVYKAKDRVLNRIVAYKVLPPTMKEDAAAVDNFYKEARAAAALTHPNIVTIHDFGVDKKGQYFITMEFIEGETIKAKLKRTSRLPPKYVVEVTKEVCKGLHFAHSRNILHRDIKSANIMITKAGYVKIMDFGLAKIIHDAMSAHTVIGGTPHYMSPEQILGEPLDARTDLYSLGITMYEMLTGRVPFTKGDIGYHHVHTPPPSLSSVLPSIHPELEKIVMKCIAKKREERFQTAVELFEALKALQL